MPPAVAPLLYRRLADDFAAQVESRLLRPGDRLPSVRETSRQRRVSLATVLRAYQLLEERGLVEVRPQSGHYVRREAPALPPRPAIPRQAVAHDQVPSADLLAELLDRCNDPAMVPFGAATAAPQLYPVERIGRLSARWARRGIGVTYDSPRGSDALRRQLAKRLRGQGVRLAADELLVTSGCTEALHLALRAITAPGDTIALESPTYYGFLGLAASLGLKVLEIPACSEVGVEPPDLARALARTRVAAFVTTPSFQNPLGFTVPAAARREIVALCARHGVPIVEDDVYAELAFDGVRPPPLKAFDEEGNVLLCSSASKIIAPGYRVGWLAAGRHAERATKLKLSTTLHTNTVGQLTIAEFMGRRAMEQHLRTLREALRAQVAEYQRAICAAFPEGTRVSRPLGGHLLWLELPHGTDASALAQRALRQRIGVMPGEFFSAGDAFRHCLRINCGHPLTDEREAALRMLGGRTDGKAEGRKGGK